MRDGPKIGLHCRSRSCRGRRFAVTEDRTIAPPNRRQGHEPRTQPQVMGTCPANKNLLLLTLPSQLAMCHKALMLLPPTDTTRFFRLYWGLNAYVNQQLAIIPKQFTADSFRNIPIEQLAAVRDVLIANLELLDRYLAEDPHHLSPEDRDAISNWRLQRAGQFIVVRHLKKYSVFLDDKPPGHLYGVVGLHSPIHEMLEQKPPMLVRTVLLPFCGAIVTDGLMSSTPVHLGRNIQEDIRQHYNRIKLRAGITVYVWTPRSVAFRVSQSADPLPTWEPKSRKSPHSRRGYAWPTSRGRERRSTCCAPVPAWLRLSFTRRASAMSGSGRCGGP